MAGKIVGDTLLPFAAADVLIAADLREHLHAAEECRGRIDKGGDPVEGIRCDAGYPDVGMVDLEVCKQA